MRLAFTSHSPDHLVVVPDYHPHYGLDDGTRARVLCLVVVDGLSVKEAAAVSGLSLSTIYKWRRDAKKDL
jgi:hypothetical protein